ncbi:uncharacterized protein LY89DRAFT_226498 [Mollisia scopiformis]|uniref:Zn(2)-C6 fungal-type domain-containing protein n=1 Tax=Mollisia scopiformis TaxID=149040 RepID=A0A194WU64_MOLSC|nr:uncharacterized protein LY89DRAFT_226498 [Mollisia scopiformis]KUJ11501.1 hypothetical protein LY89DRAFT_226498 [Mollisia scopiformis]
MEDSIRRPQALASKSPRRRASSSPEPDRSNPKKQKRIACRECRQAKLKCDKSSNTAEPCARCRKLSLECRVETEYKRYNKKIRINDLAEEIERLRSSVTGSGASTAQPILGPGLSYTSRQIVDPPHLQQGQSPQDSPIHVPEVSLNTAPPGQRPFSPPRDISQDRHTADQARSIGFVQLSPEQIKDLFQIFFEHHHHFLDIIDSSLTPESCYASSPLLFWAIISVAARHYDKRPKLLSSLSQHVTSLIWNTISVMPHSRYTIQAILLISLWPFPTNSMTTDISFMLVNMAKTASMQLGLHRPEVVQDFLRVKTRLDPVQFQKAVKLWAGCYIASQCVSASIGQQSVLPSDWVIDQACILDNQYTLPDNLRYHLLICKFIAKANNVMAERERKSDENEGLILVAMLEADFADLERQIGHKITSIHQILLLMASLQLRTYFFFVKHNPEARREGILKAYCTALTLINKCANAESSWGFTRYAPDGWNHILSMAAMLIMKIIHSSYAKYIDADEGERAFNSVISLMQSASVQENDVRYRVCVVLTQLWGVHQSISVRKDEEPSLSVKSRLGASILHDALWQWREKFGRRSDMHPVTMESKVSVGDDLNGEPNQEDQSNSIRHLPLPDGIPPDLGNDPFNFGMPDPDWIWDVGFPAFLPVDIDSNSLSYPPWTAT